MLDLIKYYLDGVSKEEYYYRFRHYILNLNKHTNIFSDETRTENVEFLILDTEEAIERFKSLCQPEIREFSQEQSCWFYLLSFFLHRQGYYIEEFPDVLRRPPNKPSDFTYGEIRRRAYALELQNYDGSISYRIRREMIANMSFKMRGEKADFDTSMENVFRIISTRDATFQEMSIDEKLLEISNFIEYSLKENDMFFVLDYSSIAFDYISDSIIKNYRKQLNCFRHASKAAIAEREKYSEAQKTFLVDFGIVIVKIIHELQFGK